MDRNGITIHGTSVHLYARPSDTSQFELPCKSQTAAGTAADRIRTARTTKRLDADTPLYAAMLTWAWWGTGHIAADKSWPKYRGAMDQLCRLTGSTPLGGVDRDRYSRVHQARVDRRWTESKLATLATTFSVRCSFAGRCPTGRADGPSPQFVGVPGDPEAATRRGRPNRQGQTARVRVAASLPPSDSHPGRVAPSLRSISE